MIFKKTTNFKVALPKVNSKFYLALPDDELRHVKLLSVNPHEDEEDNIDYCWFSLRFLDLLNNNIIYTNTSWFQLSNIDIDLLEDLDNEEADLRLAKSEEEWNFGDFVFLFKTKADGQKFVRRMQKKDEK